MRLSRQVNLKETCKSGSLHCPAASTKFLRSKNLVPRAQSRGEQIKASMFRLTQAARSWQATAGPDKVEIESNGVPSE